MAISSCVALALIPSSASAQGFFESLFGFGTTQRSPLAIPQKSSPAADLPYREPTARPYGLQHPDRQAPRLGGKYRTLCVRMCDGYYFPISGSVSQSAFYRDAQTCRRSCGSQAELFYHASSSGDASEMVDLTGRSYARLPNAFRYRKQLVEGCRCRPEPWSVSEIARHQSYTGAEAQGERANEEPSSGAFDNADRVAGVMDEASSHDDQRAAQSTPSESDAENRRAAAIMDAPAPVIRPTPVRSPRYPYGSVSGPTPVASGRSSPHARRDPPATQNTQPTFFGLSFGGPSQKRLRWPGD